MRAGRVIVTYELLAQALGLPSGNEIVAIAPQTADEVGSQRFSIIVAGDDMPKHREGASLQVVTFPL